MTDSADFERLEAHDGTVLFCQYYPARNPQGVIVTLHDYALHSGVYLSAHEHFVASGYSVYTMDLRGHGKSAGARAAIEDFDDYLEDLDLLLARVSDREAVEPLFLLGQGMGALIALRFVTTRRASFHGLILCDGLPLLPISVKERLLAQYAGLLLSRIEAHAAAREILLPSALLATLPNDELVFRGPIKARTVAEINAANSFPTSGQEFLSFPVLCLTGERQRLIMDKLHDRLVTHDKALVSFQGQSLQLLLGEEGKAVIQAVVKWCGKRLEKLSDEDEWGDPADDGI